MISDLHKIDHLATHEYGKDLGRVHEAPKHLPPRLDARKTKIVEEDSDLQDEPMIKTEKSDDFGFERTAASPLDVFDINDLTDKEQKELLDAANDRLDDKLFDIDPYLALRVALDYTLWYGPDGMAEGSWFNLIGHDLYDQLLADLGDKHGIDVYVNWERPFTARKDHRYLGLDLIQEGSFRTAGLIEDLVKRRDVFKVRVKNMDNYLTRVQRTQDQTALAKEQLQRSLQVIDEELELEIKKLTNYQQFLREALTRAVGDIFQDELGTSPLVRIKFQETNPQDEETSDVWVLSFSVLLQELFDPKRDRRFDLTDDGSIVVSDVEGILNEAGERVKKKLSIVQRSFERFLGAKVDINSDNHIRGQIEDGKYRAFADFSFQVSVPVKDDADIKLITLAITDSLKDLTDSNWGRLANRVSTSLVSFYKDI